MRFASLGSGSEGNGLLVECGATRVLIDCGFSLSESVSRLDRLLALAAATSPDVVHGPLEILLHELFEASVFAWVHFEPSPPCQ